MAFLYIIDGDFLVEEIVIGIKKGDEIFDTQTAEVQDISGDEIYYDNSDDALEIIRHSTAHLMAQAIKMLYPDAKFFVGPVIEDGFYYDFRTQEKISDSDLKAIEKQMKALIKKKFQIEQYSISKTDVLEKFAEDDLKQEVLKRINDENITIYKQGEFEDLCRGPHVPNTKYLHNFKLIRVAGAYLGGDESARC